MSKRLVELSKCGELAKSGELDNSGLHKSAELNKKGDLSNCMKLSLDCLPFGLPSPQSVVTCFEQSLLELKPPAPGTRTRVSMDESIQHLV